MPCTASFIRGLFWGFLIYASVERIEGLILRSPEKNKADGQKTLVTKGSQGEFSFLR